ncbi:MAG: type I restriction endonuclease [Arthrospira sp. SH-MAG29]|nr:type I restriction endonuclease [Arthrospira sp. SH-MAG29]MBS0015241.1 type I restriction endonuclease [Arthrospira sp. SH-MAG29]
MPSEIELLEIATTQIRKVAKFDPYKSYPEVGNREEFKQLIARDPAFGVLGLDDDRYVIARVGGNLVTSLHRKLGDLYEQLFSYLLKESFSLNENDLHFGVEVKIGDRVQYRSTDGLIRQDQFNQRIPESWRGYQGIGFEVRSCYQIGDSKRIQADYDMSLSLKAYNILPVMLVFCSTSLRSPLARLSKSWVIYEGMDCFNFVESITGFNLYKFLTDNSDILKQEIQNIFSSF